MNVLLISQCSKNALTETRRILDQFAERRGERTWQTSITQQGLDTLRRLLRKTARKNTAVTCHWIRGLDHSEMLWVVGDASQFNAQGAVPTNSTARNVLRRQDESDWHTGEDIRLLAALAALLHDLGKASRAFQKRLSARAQPERNQYRHEWVSLRLFQAFVGEDGDEQWLRRLIESSAEDDASWLMLQRLRRDGLDPETDKPLSHLPPLARALGWLVLTHHRLPVKPERDERGIWRPLGAKLRGFRSSQIADVLESIDAQWNELPSSNDSRIVEPYWTFDHGLPVTSVPWRKRAARLARRLLDRLPSMCDGGWLNDPYVMHVARLGLMLADHHYSGLTEQPPRLCGEENYPLYANTRRDTGETNQSLDEHLLGVEKHASLIVHALPDLVPNLPHLARHRGLKQRSCVERFQWQNKAADIAASVCERSMQRGFFGVNMASTGCGKTLANVRIMNALADPQQGLRCAIALGLRTLTLQTGQALRGLLGLGEDEVAIRVGGAASRELFEHYARQAERSGSESGQDLLPDEGGVLFEGNSDHAVLSRLTNDARVRSLLAAPILVCTVDHLVPATESQRGGHQIVPMLRLMSGDLVLDELDDFDIDDLPALTRLVYWTGLLGSRVLLSSATLPPAIVEGMFAAYRSGREIYQRNRGESPGAPTDICCAWFDEFGAQAQACADAGAFEVAHLAFAKTRHAKLGQAEPRRLTRLVEFSIGGRGKAATRQAFAAAVREQALALHAIHHSLDPRSGKRVSFGLVRMANIEPLVDVALALYALGIPDGAHIHLCVYHSQFPLLLRSAMESRLDAALDRRDENAVFSLPDIRLRLDAHPEPDQLFIVLGSPVTEVGRDHDYDWAVVEPSSMRSLIQLAGRVRRHRIGACKEPNIVLFETNVRHQERPDKAAFCRPGFEMDEGAFHLDDHSLRTLLADDERATLDARPRILPRQKSQWLPNRSLVDLEHARLSAQMQPAPPPAPLSARDLRIGKKPSDGTPINASSFWTQPLAYLTAVLPQQQRFREENAPDVDLVLLPDETSEDYVLKLIRDGKDLVGGRAGENVFVDAPETRIDEASVRGANISSWGAVSYMDELVRLADELGLSLDACARRYGTLSIRKSEQGWRFHPALGFSGKPVITG